MPDPMLRSPQRTAVRRALLRAKIPSKALRLFLALAYAGFGGLPSMTTPLRGADPGGEPSSCRRGSCECKPGSPKAGCCCDWKKTLLKRFPDLAQDEGFMEAVQAGQAGACSVSGACAGKRAGPTPSVPFRHILVRSPSLVEGAGRAAALEDPVQWRPDHVREAPEPVPKGRPLP